MDVKQNPFSIYDFLGYLIPGAVFLYGTLFVLGHISPLDNPFGFNATNLSFNKPETYIPFVLLAYIVGHFLSFLSSITVERYSIWAHGYPSKYLLGISPKGYFNVTQSVPTRLIVRFLVAAMLAPISVLDWLLGSKAGMRDLYAKRLDVLLIKVLSQRIERLIEGHAGVANSGSQGEANSHDSFRYVYHFAIENAPNHGPKMQNYVGLYGFLRTLTLISLAVFWIVVWHVMTTHLPCSTGTLYIVLAGTLSYLLFMGFVKFFRRFSLEALMAMAVTYK